MLKKIEIGDKLIVYDKFGGEGKSRMGVVYLCLYSENNDFFALKHFKINLLVQRK